MNSQDPSEPPRKKHKSDSQSPSFPISDHHHRPWCLEYFQQWWFETLRTLLPPPLCSVSGILSIIAHELLSDSIPVQLVHDVWYSNALRTVLRDDGANGFELFEMQDHHYIDGNLLYKWKILWAEDDGDKEEEDNNHQWSLDEFVSTQIERYCRQYRQVTCRLQAVYRHTFPEAAGPPTDSDIIVKLVDQLCRPAERTTMSHACKVLQQRKTPDEFIQQMFEWISTVRIGDILVTDDYRDNGLYFVAPCVTPLSLPQVMKTPGEYTLPDEAWSILQQKQGERDSYHYADFDLLVCRGYQMVHPSVDPGEEIVQRDGVNVYA